MTLGLWSNKYNDQKKKYIDVSKNLTVENNKHMNKSNT